MSTWTLTERDDHWHWTVQVDEDTGEGNRPTEPDALRDIANALDFLKGGVGKTTPTLAEILQRQIENQQKLIALTSATPPNLAKLLRDIRPE